MSTAQSLQELKEAEKIPRHRTNAHSPICALKRRTDLPRTTVQVEHYVQGWHQTGSTRTLIHGHQSDGPHVKFYAVQGIRGERGTHEVEYKPTTVEMPHHHQRRHPTVDAPRISTLDPTQFKDTQIISATEKRDKKEYRRN